MPLFSNLSIRQKLVALVLMASILALAFVVGAVVLYEVTTFRPRALARLNQPADILAEVLPSTLTFQDPESATRYLKKCCQTQSDILAAALYDGQGMLFASNRVPGDAVVIPAAAQPASTNFAPRELSLWRNIGKENSEPGLGRLYLLLELPPLYKRLPQYGIMLGAVTLTLVVVGYVLLQGASRHFLRPLGSLVRTTEEITRNSDYSARAVVRRNDELGRLSRSFNQMIEVIGQRDAALREASARIQSVFDSATEVAIVAADAQGGVTLFNKGAERMLGYHAEEVVGKVKTDVFHKHAELEERSAEMSQSLGREVSGFDAYLEWLRRGQSEKRDWTFVRKDGSELKVHLVVTTVRDPQGNIEGYLGVANDVTDRKRAEDELRKLAAVVMHSSELVNLATLDGKMIYLNEAGSKMLGIPSERVAQTDILQVLPEPTREFVKSEVLPLLKRGGHWEGDLQYRNQENGTIRDVRTMAFAITDPEKGIPLYLATVSSDVTERKRAIEALRVSEEYWRTTFDAIGDAVALVSVDGKVLKCNAAMEKVAGKPAGEIIGRRCCEVMHHSADPLAGCPVDRARQSKKRETVDMDLGERQFEVAVDPLFDGEHRFAGAVHIMSDITERNRAGEERARLQAQLLQAQKMDSIGRLAGGVAHDFNNMLSVILGHSELAMEEAGPDSSLRPDLQEIQEAAQRSAALTRQLLAFARRQTIAPRVLNLNETAADMLKMLKRLIGEGIELIWIPGGDLWPVKIDPSQVDQILANLCVNARDAIGGVGKVTIQTRKAVLDEHYCSENANAIPGDYVELSVSDTGCGMAKEVLEHVFEPFFTTKAVGHGTGLGLATVYGVVKQNNGSINVYSEPGRGTCFKIYLPRHADSASVEGPVQPRLTRGTETVLLVEDEPALLRISRTMLERLGYRVLAANSPDEALLLAEKHASDIRLLMTDVVMPEMNGRELAQRLTERYPNLKHLFMSGYTADVIAQHGVLEEGEHFIQKPFSSAALAKLLREVLDGTPPPQASN